MLYTRFFLQSDSKEGSEMTLIYSIPAALLLLFAVVIAIAAAGGGQIYVHHRFSSQDFVAHNEVGGIAAKPQS
jgi:hypothetical protein